MTETAREVGVSRQALYAWMKRDPVFQAAYNQWHDEMRKSVRARMRMLMQKAADAVEKSLENGDGKLGLRMLEKMGMAKDEEAGPTDAEEVEELRKIEKKQKELRVRKTKAVMESQESDLEMGITGLMGGELGG